ncbi:tetratricopeptide repeat protein [Fundidesulfovibrio terrae]|uniref:tetratricopeptide repeat protein n=1 Tax=Fundidesulfovibrio terrae TaxID=2922866 RepID=UPI001FAEBF6A|nr:tetratricopeptide repeat protein [Fundidesulfovibrio terrae]
MSESENQDTPSDSQKSSSRSREKIKGIFSTQSIQKVGTGTTTRKTIQKTYWFVEEVEENLLEIQPLNKNYIPSGPKRKITIEDLLSKFAPEPEFYVSTVYPKLQELSRTIQKGERHRDKGEIFSAELEFGEALKVDEENVRANFGLGLTYLDRGEAHKANDIFERLVRLDAAFEAEHKHLFNDFGISLRKNKMLDQALDYYRKAESLTDSDENLFYNIARAYFEKENTTECLEYLKKALKLNPALAEARLFVKYMVDQNMISASAPGISELLPGASATATAGT